MTLGIDEVNTISIEEEIKEYFSVMDITKKQKEEREEAAKDLFPIFLFLFALLGYAEEYDLPYEYVLMQFRMQFGSVAYQYYDDAEEYIDFLTKQVLEATLKDNSTLTLKDGEHWVSPERALELSENEANSLLNYQELKNAIQQGKTHKTWVTERDNRVRDDHRKMDGKTIPIMDYFHFPDCDMLCPHDVVNGTAKQNSGCRCSLRYSTNKEGKTDFESVQVYERARSFSTIEDLRAVSNSSIINMSSLEEIVEYFKNQHNLDVTGFPSSRLEDMKMSFSGLDDMMTRYPEIKDNIHTVEYNPGMAALGKWFSDGTIKISSKGLKDYGTGIHEAAHALDYVRTGFGSSYSESVTNQAVKNLGLRRNSKNYKNLTFQITQSVKDANNQKELFAYAIETAMSGVNNELAVEIERITRGVTQ